MLRRSSKALAGLEHAPLKGRFREILIQELLAPYLPPHVDTLSGTIVGCNGEHREARNEDDVVLFDHTLAPLLHNTGGRDSIMPITGVRAHIEVKTTLTLSDVTGILAAAAELIRMVPDTPPGKPRRTLPVGLVFAYDSNIAANLHIPDLLLDRLEAVGYRPSSEQTPCPIQGVCVMGRGSWFLTEKDGASGWYQVDANEDRELLAFVSIVSNSAYGNETGLGTHVLDTSWLTGPKPASPVLEP